MRLRQPRLPGPDGERRVDRRARPDSRRWQAAADAARAGDAVAIAAFAQAGEYVGRVLAGAIVLLWPERVVVGGGVADAGELLLGPMREELRRRACVAPVDDIAVVAAELGPQAGAVGAALWAAEAPRAVRPRAR